MKHKLGVAAVLMLISITAMVIFGLFIKPNAGWGKIIILIGCNLALMILYTFFSENCFAALKKCRVFKYLLFLISVFLSGFIYDIVFGGGNILMGVLVTIGNCPSVWALYVWFYDE